MSAFGLTGRVGTLSDSTNLVTSFEDGILRVDRFGARSHPFVALSSDGKDLIPQNERTAANLVQLPSEDQKIIHAVGFHEIL